MNLISHFQQRVADVHPLLRAAFWVRRACFLFAIVLNAFAIVWTFSSNGALPETTPMPSSVIHFINYSGYLRNLLAYGFMAFFYLAAFPRHMAIKLSCILGAMAILFETLQLLVPTRDFSYLDMLNSLVGIALAFYANSYLKKLYWERLVNNEAAPETGKN